MILVVDDEQMIRDLILQVARGIKVPSQSTDSVDSELAELRVVLVADGDEAINFIINTHRPDLVVTDLQMPRMDGIDVALTALALKSKVVLMSSNFRNVGRSDERRIVRLTRRGVITLGKPFKPGRLRNLMRQLLSG